VDGTRGDDAAFDRAVVDALFESAPAAVALLDEQLAVVRANDRFVTLRDDRLRARVISCARTAADEGRPVQMTYDGDPPRAVACRPVLVAGARAVGVLVVVDDPPSSVDRDADEQLQRALLPTVLPTVENLDVAARYVPARDAVAGDWYDVVRLADGRIALVVGDVVGAGVAALGIMAALRYALLVFASETADPARLLDRLNRYACRRRTDSCTVAIAVIDTDADEATVASAGHVPAFVRRASGDVLCVGSELGVPLGVLAAAEFRTESVAYHAGDALVLITDGVVQRRGEPVDVGLQRAEAAVRGDWSTPEALADAVLDADTARDDDAVVLVARRPIGSDFVFTARAEPSQLALLRQLLDRWLSARGVTQPTRGELLLAVSEAAANTVEHAYGPRAVGQLRVRAAQVADGIAVEVADDGQWRGRQPAGGGRGLGLMEALADSVAVDRGAHGTTVRLRRFLPQGIG
jgi:anti-sigma regulatory factor (Ser/Thr protein kinase)